MRKVGGIQAPLEGGGGLGELPLSLWYVTLRYGRCVMGPTRSGEIRPEKEISGHCAFSPAHHGAHHHYWVVYSVPVS